MQLTKSILCNSQHNYKTTIREDTLVQPSVKFSNSSLLTAGYMELAITKCPQYIYDCCQLQPQA